MDAVTVEHLSKTRGKNAANIDLSFNVATGELFGLLGSNGAGKTSLILQILGLLTPTTGRICVLGLEIPKQARALRPLAAFLPQHGMPMGHLNMRQALFFTGCLRGLKAAASRQQADYWIERFDLGSFSSQLIERLSGGQARLVAIAMTLMGDPSLLVLDEPTNELDPHYRQVVWGVLRERSAQDGATCILVTHNVLEAERIVDRVGIMKAGRFVALDRPSAIKSQVDSWASIEVSLKPGATLPEAWVGRMKDEGDNRFRLRCEQRNLPQEMERLLVDLAVFESLQIIPPSLEDAYFLLDHKSTEKLQTQEKVEIH